MYRGLFFKHFKIVIDCLSKQQPLRNTDNTYWFIKGQENPLEIFT